MTQRICFNYLMCFHCFMSYLSSFFMVYPRHPPGLLSNLAPRSNLTSLRGIDILRGDLHLFTTRNEQFPSLKEFSFSVDWPTCGPLLDSMCCKFGFLEIYIRGEVLERPGLGELTAAFAQHL